MIQTYIAIANQNIYDVCLMTYGTLDNLTGGQSALFKLMQDNDFGSVNNYPLQGQKFKWDDTLVFNEAANQSNSLTKVVYATRASGVGNITYNIQSNGLPIQGNQIITPVQPISGPNTKYDYYLVFNSDIRWNKGSLTFTDPYLVGKTGYAVYAQQNSQFFSVTEGGDLHYDAIAGTFRVLSAGFELIDGYYLVVYPNKFNTTIP